MHRPIKFIVLTTVGLLSCSMAFGQQESTEPESSVEEPIDEVIAEGRRAWEGHDGMEAFWNGDFETAEIEFEQEFKSLKRFESARYNAAVDSALAIDRANNSAQSSGSGGQVINTPGGSVAVQSQNNAASNVAYTSQFRNKRGKGKNLLNDGQVTEEDFGFTKYMAGLSELQLGKNDEAKKSFKSSVFYDGDNYDARMRLGLLYLQDRNFDKAADQLEAIEKLRVKCKKKSCTEYDEILQSASTLAQNLTNVINSKQ